MHDASMASRLLSPMAIIFIFMSVLVLWMVTPIVMLQLYPDIAHRGLAGDLFGSVNALFSGLAFAGVIVAILLQREELKLQRQELAANRLELSRSATAQEESRESLRRTIYAQAYKTAIEILQEESVRDARRVVLAHLSNKLFGEWSESDIRHAEIVCHTYDIVGAMIKHGMMPVEYISPWSPSVR